MVPYLERATLQSSVEEFRLCTKHGFMGVENVRPTCNLAVGVFGGLIKPKDAVSKTVGIVALEPLTLRSLFVVRRCRQERSWLRLWVQTILYVESRRMFTTRMSAGRECGSCAMDVTMGSHGHEPAAYPSGIHSHLHADRSR